MTLPQKPTSASGFSLVELAVVMTVMGLLLGGAVGMMKPYYDDFRYSSTQKKMAKIADTLALFAQQHNRLPCPAEALTTTTNGEPYGTPRRSGPNGNNYTAICSDSGAFTEANHIGIIPFRALGLTEEDAKDGYGNLMTYMVAGEMAGDSVGNVQEACRTPVWISGSINRNTEKAQFCCPPVTAYSANGIRLLTPDGNRVFSAVGETVPVYAAPTVPAANPPTRINPVIGFLLLSHGLNGDNAPVRNGARRPVTNSAGTNEENNGTTMSPSLSDFSTTMNANYYDDLMLWRTNTQLMSAFGTNSCAGP